MKGRTGSTSTTGSSNKSIHMSFSDCSIDIDADHSADASKMSLCSDFRQLCGEGGQADALLQCLEMYGFEKPWKLQQRAIPAILQVLGRQLNGLTGNAGKGKSCIVIQGPARIGKTSSVVLALLASIDPSIPRPQAILLTTSSKRDFDKYLSVFTLMQSVTFQSFMEDDDDHSEVLNPIEFSEEMPEVKAALQSHILVGHPRRILRLLSSVQSLCLDSVKALVIDDAEEILYSGPATAAAPAARPSPSPRVPPLGAAATAGSPSSASGRRGPPLPEDSLAEHLRASGVEVAPRRRPSGARSALFTSSRGSSSANLAVPTSGASSSSSSSDDLIQICNVLECRQYSQNLSDTYRIRQGSEQGPKLRYIILSQQLSDRSSQKVLRLLKNSLMKKKNLLSVESCLPPTRLIKAMKHYYVLAPRTEWVAVFASLVQSLMFPRALVFCDDEGGGPRSFLTTMQRTFNLAVSANLPDVPGPGGEQLTAAEARRRAVQDFTSNKSQFLLTRSEPTVCQLVLPKVSCVFHFGVPAKMPSVYGVRLLPLDANLVKDSASILFVEPQQAGSGAVPDIVADIGKTFGIRLMDMPFEFLPASVRAPQAGQSSEPLSPLKPAGPRPRPTAGGFASLSQQPRRASPGNIGVLHPEDSSMPRTLPPSSGLTRRGS